MRGTQGGPGILKDRLDHRPVLFQGVAVQRMDIFPIDEHLAGGRLFQTQDELGGRRLATAGLAHQGEGLPRWNREADAVHGLDPADDLRPEQALGDGKMFFQPLGPEDGRGFHACSNLQQSAVWPSPTVNEGG